MNYAAESLRAGKWVENVRKYRNAVLFATGLVILASQLYRSLTGDASDPALVTAGSSILLSPLLLSRDEKK